MARQKKTLRPKALRLKVGKGVLAKDGKTPFAPRTLHVTQRGWHSPIDYSMSNLVKALFADEVTEIHLIDEQNDEYRVEIERQAARPTGDAYEMAIERIRAQLTDQPSRGVTLHPDDARALLGEEGL